MSTSAPAIGAPALSTTRALTNSGAPGVSDGTMDPPFSTRGEFSRQNGPSSDCVVSVLPWSPLFSRHTSEGNAERAGDQHHFIVAVVGLPAEFDQDSASFAELGFGQPDVTN